MESIQKGSEVVFEANGIEMEGKVVDIRGDKSDIETKWGIFTRPLSELKLKPVS